MLRFIRIAESIITRQASVANAAFRLQASSATFILKRVILSVSFLFISFFVYVP